MTVTPTSSLALCMDGVIDLFAQSSIFQARVAANHPNPTGLSAENLARQFIYCFDGNDEDDESIEWIRPCVVLGFNDARWESIVYCSALQYMPQGMIVALLTDTARNADWERGGPDARSDSFMDALNWMGGIFDGWSGVAAGDVAFPIRRIHTIQPPIRPPLTERSEGNDYWLGIWALEYGEEMPGG